MTLKFNCSCDAWVVFLKLQEQPIPTVRCPLSLNFVRFRQGIQQVEDAVNAPILLQAGLIFSNILESWDMCFIIFVYFSLIRLCPYYSNATLHHGVIWGGIT